MKQLLIVLTMMLTASGKSAQTCPDDNHPHAIDLGLPSGAKWACCNVGATTPEGHGSYYAWGETEEKEIYDWTSYIHGDGTMETCHDIGQDISGTEYDVAHVQWGGAWVMPTQDLIKELINECSCTWTRRNDVNGDLLTGPGGGTIFLPEADFWRKGSANSAADASERESDQFPSAGYYWASTQRASVSSQASSILLSYGNASWDTYDYRSSGLTVRPVIMGVGTSVSSTPSAAMRVYRHGGYLTVSSLEDGTPVSIFDLSGRLLAEGSSHGSTATLSANLQADQMVVVRAGGRVMKVVVR